MAFEPAQVVAGAILGGVFASVNRWWQYRRENWYSRITLFCDLAAEAADTASDYWLDEVDSTLITTPSLGLNQARGRISKFECILIGFQSQLDGLYGSFSHRLSFRDRPRLETLLRDLTDALTGGQFQVRDRKIDLARARAAHVLASNLIVEVRHSLDRAIKLRGLLEYFVQYPHR